MANTIHIPSPDPIEIAERIFLLLDSGRFTATYKYATMLALLDLCMERSDRNGIPPTSVTTKQIAEKFIELYWPHTNSYKHKNPHCVLLQNTSGQARVISLINKAKDRTDDPSLPFSRFKIKNGSEYNKLINRVEFEVIINPLPRLQNIDGAPDEHFLYSINWDTKIDQKIVSQYHKGQSDFNNQILFHEGIPETLIRLNALLRPLIHQRWTAMVAKINEVPESHLSQFLFDKSRENVIIVRDELRQIQNDRCFYTNEPLGKDVAVDHFIPWARYPDNNLANLVLANSKVNLAKLDHLAAIRHLKKWADRNFGNLATIKALKDIEHRRAFPFTPDKSLNIARSIYYKISDKIDLWVNANNFERIDRNKIHDLLRINLE